MCLAQATRLWLAMFIYVYKIQELGQTPYVRERGHVRGPKDSICKRGHRRDPPSFRHSSFHPLSRSTSSFKYFSQILKEHFVSGFSTMKNIND